MSRTRRRLALLALAVAALGAAAGVLLAGRGSGATQSRLTVFAAASLTDVFPRIEPAASYSFGGSNMLAAQIEQGAPADVFASADTALPRKLHARRLCGTPVVFARNVLVLVVPRANPAHIRTVRDLTRNGVKVVIAATGVPVGDYTLQLLRTLHLEAAVLRHVASRESDVRGVLAKVALGEADAGFVYATDARTVPGKVRVLGLPARAEPKLAYALCVVSATHSRAAAQAFVRRVLGSAGQAKLAAAGFRPVTR